MRELLVVNPRRDRRHIMDLLRKERWSVGVRPMKRLWKQEGLMVPMKRRRIGKVEKGIVRRRASIENEVRGMDFVQDRTADGRPPHAGGAGRVHAGMPGNRGGTELPRRGHRGGA